MRGRSKRRSVLFAKVEDGAGGNRCFLGSLGDSCEEEAEPSFPVAGLADRGEAVVVLGPVSPEVDAEVEERAVQDSPVDEEEADQESPDTAVTVQERVDRLELRMSEPDVDQCRQLVVVEKPLEVVEGLLHLVNRRRHERRLGQGGVLGADPVLRLAELAGPAVRSAHAGQELPVDLGDQAKRQGEVGHPREAVVHRPHVVDDLVHILGKPAPGWLGVELRGQQVLERALGALDL
jgi:hypothetical protein